MIGLGLKIPRGKSDARASILLSGVTVTERTAVGTVVGTLSVINATGTPAFTLEDDAGGLFVLDGSAVETAGAIDYEAATTHTITVSVADVTPAIANTNFIIDVIDVAEDGGLDFSFVENSQALAALLDF